MTTHEIYLLPIKVHDNLILLLHLMKIDSKTFQLPETYQCIISTLNGHIFLTYHSIE